MPNPNHAKKEPKEHILRPALPWRDEADGLTECGLDACDCLAVSRERRPLVWHRAVKAYMRRWIAEHRDGRQDTWTRHRHLAADARREG